MTLIEFNYAVATMLEELPKEKQQKVEEAIKKVQSLLKTTVLPLETIAVIMILA